MKDYIPKLLGIRHPIKTEIHQLPFRAKNPEKNVLTQDGITSGQKWIAFEEVDRTALLNRIGKQAEPKHG
ncbi:MAG TPA: hypothetical protein DCS60_07170 [Opitutae bacterium]|nr:hypothetical protein [Opitutae bacterium]